MVQTVILGALAGWVAWVRFRQYEGARFHVGVQPPGERAGSSSCRRGDRCAEDDMGRSASTGGWGDVPRRHHEGWSRPRSRRPFVLGLATVLVLALAVGLLTAVQRRLIYFPDPSAVPPAGEVIDGARDVTLHTSDGLELDAWFVPARSASDTNQAVLVAPGNGGNRSGRAGLATELSRRGLAVLLMDYRGYGGNPGSPTEDGLAKDAGCRTGARRAGLPGCTDHLLR